MSVYRWTEVPWQRLVRASTSELAKSVAALPIMSRTGLLTAAQFDGFMILPGLCVVLRRGGSVGRAPSYRPIG